MDADDWRLPTNSPMDERDSAFLFALTLDAEDFKRAESRRQLGASDDTDGFFGTLSRGAHSLFCFAWHERPRIISGDSRKRRFTSGGRLANVTAAGKVHENAYFQRRFAAHAPAPCWRGGVDLRLARALGYLPKSTLHRTQRFRSEIEAYAICHASACIWRDPSYLRGAVSSCGLDARRVVPARIARRARSWPARRVDHQPAGVCAP